MTVTYGVAINNFPDDATKLKYIVARYFDKKWWYWGTYEYEENAYLAAEEIGGFVFELLGDE